MDWPDWRGEIAVIVATGPSAGTAPLEVTKGAARVIAIKQSWRLCPWADVLYGIDRGWWIATRGMREFRGLRVSPSPSACNVFGLGRVRLKSRAEILTAEPGVIGCGLKHGGGHSGFQAINLAIQFGARRIALVGFDMTLAGGAHWHDDYRGQSPPEAGRVRRWREEFDACAPQFVALGVDVINCSPQSVLTAYRKMSLQEAMSRWRGLEPASNPSPVMSS